MQNIAAPDSASELIWVKCQSLASPFTAEYWHIGATMMRLGSARPRSLMGENRALMANFPDRRNDCLPLSSEPAGFPQPQPTQHRSSLRGAKRRSNPKSLCRAMDCFAELA